MSSANTTTLPLYKTCPPGLTGDLCAGASCDSPFVAPAKRAAKPATDKRCQTCTDGFSGLNCNICTAVKDACQLAQRATGAKASLPSGTIINNGANGSYTFDTSLGGPVCHRQPDPVATQYAQCMIDHPTLASMFPNTSITMTMIKVAEADATNQTGLAEWESAPEPGSTLSQVWLDGVEQFYCQSTGCSSKNDTAAVTGGGTAGAAIVNAPNPSSGNSSANLGSNVWSCNTLKCTCLPNSKICAGDGTIALGGIINSLSGQLQMPCDYLDPANPSATGKCQFKGGQLTTLLGPQGLPLSDCQFGSCVSQSQMQYYWDRQAGGSGSSSSSGSKINLSGPVKGGLVVLAVVAASLIGLLVWGIIRRHRARFRPRKQGEDPCIGLQWENIEYVLANGKGRRGGGGAFSQKLGLSQERYRDDPSGNEKVAPLGTEEKPAVMPAAKSVQSDASPAGSSALEMDDLPSQGKLAYDVASTEAAGNKSILKSVSGSAPPGSLVALLGPSGAGKTTLVELLASREKSGRMTGAIDLTRVRPANAAGEQQSDYTDVLSDSLSGRRLIAFVDQEDQLPAHSTVREALRFAAELSLPENVPEKEKVAVVEGTIHTLGLEAVSESRIGSRGHRGISGGEKRRVSIGIALVARPRILILDEPLSGLDAYNANRVIQALRDLAYKADGATTVMLTLHQPSSDIFYKFDKTIFLAGGKTLYDGAPSEALDWCAQQGRPCPPGYNVADHLLDMAFRDNAFNAVDALRLRTVPDASSPATVKISRDSHAGASLRRTGAATTWFTQTRALVRRHLVTARRDMTGPAAHLVMHIMVGLLAGACFFQVKKTISGIQNRVGSLYFLNMLQLFASLSAITHLAALRPLMVRERADGFYSPGAWVAAHVSYDLLLWRLIPGVCLQVIVYWMVGLKPYADDFFEFILVCEVFYIVVALYMMILAALVSDLSVAILLGGGFVLFNIGMGGFLLNLETLPHVVRWIPYACPMKYVLEAVTINEVQGLKIQDTLEGLPIDIDARPIAKALFGLTGTYYRDLLILALAFTLGFAAILAGSVWWRMRDRR